MEYFVQKITSRKFLTCIAGIIIGICMAFGIDEGAVNIVAGAITSLSSVIVYIYTEGKIDAAAVSGIKDAVDKVTDAIDVVDKIEE